MQVEQSDNCDEQETQIPSPVFLNILKEVIEL